ncbi:unnamed protein product [Caenorhabditis auriculariae]|uniref:RNA-directed RNA polymerase n=1 Tax=Caenorhabditis auriculariae TaxID=2777116 RepID=A0A8S1HLU5_9PELO|nr:unnamed protein product [Caenorhabditis auriculariae]
MSVDSEGARGWVKIEIPHSWQDRLDSRSANERIRNLIESQVVKLPPALEMYGMKVLSTSEIQKVEEQDCEAYYEVNFEVTSDHFDKKLLLALQRYFDDINRDGFMPFQRGNLVLHTPVFFSDELKCCMKDLPISAIHFGNLQGGILINHWEVSFWPETHKRLNKDRPDEISMAEADSLFRLFVDFEFDKGDMIIVHYKDREMMDVMDQAKGRKEKQLVTTWYQITIKRQTIRRIICDPLVNDMNGSGRYRIHFDLNCPVLIRRGYFTDARAKESKHAIPTFVRWLHVKRGRDQSQYPNDLAIADSPVFTLDFEETIQAPTIYLLLSRLRLRIGCPIEFSVYPAVDCLYARDSPYHRWTWNQHLRQYLPPTHPSTPHFGHFINSLFPRKKEIQGTRNTDVNKERKFAITYLIECLISRGAVVKDQLLLEEKIWSRFLEIIFYYCTTDHKLCEAALEDLVHMLDGRKRIGSLMKCFDNICKTRLRNKLTNGLTEEEMREGYQRVRKLIFTPTRVIYVAPETLMGNRVLRKYDHDGTRVLRVTFRDDDNTKMRANKTSDLIIDRVVGKYLRDGICVAGRDFGYLGSSNSQMRDNGAYFMEKYSKNDLRDYREAHKKNPPPDFAPKIRDARKALGRFEEVDNIPKMMARLGQCFTQSRLSGVNLKRSSYITTCDLVGGRNKKGDEFTFSDGVGMMSRAFAEEVSKVMQLGKGVPSCFQFRFRGMKGMIAVEPFLDELRVWADRNKLEPLGEEMSWEINCAFRQSQIKFVAKRHERDQVEIVKYSSPVPVALNKPFINILDQVSEMQSMECHRRVTNRIEELLDRQMLGFAQFMVDETSCRNRLKELPRRIDIDYLKPSVFTLSNEPFFRSLIKASIKYSITRQLRKEQIPIPADLGRSMLGVVDETGRLQYGQIFVQYTKNIALKLPPATAAKAVLKGKVLLTKNPCIVSGDVRVFEAVDIPELHHMLDVVVFPQCGPRPHPDEMAGSDLDGDEYSVIWDQDLLLDRNEEPFDFTSDKKKEKFDESDVDRLMREFYIKYLKLDSVGTISNSHLHCSDQYGLNAKVCMNLAKKNCQAVDFTKSGDAPSPLVNVWEKDPDTDEMIPPERPERVPDFSHWQRLFREIKAIDDVLRISEERDEQLEITIDSQIQVPGFEFRLGQAREELAKYNAQLRSLMENYGIRTEGEIFSGCIIEMRNRISEKDQDDMSFYNTNQMLETKVSLLFKKYREQFFEEFGGWQMCTEKSTRAYADELNVLQRTCKDPSMEMQKKAVAYYRACYEEAKTTRENKKLSFAWLAYDVLYTVRLNSILQSDVSTGINPLYTMLESHRDQYIRENFAAFEEYLRFEPDSPFDNRIGQANKILQMYIIIYPGLERVLFLLYEWARRAQLLEKGFKKHHFAFLLILFATRHFGSVDGKAAAIFEKIDEAEYQQGNVNAAPLSELDQSRLLISFLEFLSSRKFRKLVRISFLPIGFFAVFTRNQWIPFHVAALKTFYNMQFNLRFEELPVSTDPAVTSRTIIRESEPFIIELPSNIDESDVRRKLLHFTGLEDVQLRYLKTQKVQENPRYLVTSRGSLEAFYKLRQLVAVKVPLNNSVTGKEISTQLATLRLQKINAGQLSCV